MSRWSASTDTGQGSWPGRWLCLHPCENVPKCDKVADDKSLLGTGKSRRVATVVDDGDAGPGTQQALHNLHHAVGGG